MPSMRCYNIVVTGMANKIYYNKEKKGTYYATELRTRI